ncbi:hypothetical protein [Nocardia sp. alder85J]|uniref:hypothetical protein n=1 Tax=Nocardia sp. alder85J TaxID=2862949 RepID=UPI001CD237F8|nr:hypothetical protein [Nocardia sp. alder85J]MCX4097930.1 hypothetical protein [Nocardia sp. alder85J]
MTPEFPLTYQRIEHHDGIAIHTTVPLPPPTGDAPVVRLAPEIAGVCRSDLREITGNRYARRDFGHEIVATVVHAPPGLAELHQRVLLDPHPVLTRGSGFAEYVDLRGTPAHLQAALVPIPHALPADVAVFGEPLACAVHCTTRLHEVSAALRFDRQEPIGVYGAGMAGTLITAALTAEGHRCVLLNPRPHRIEFLRRSGALPPAIPSHDTGQRFTRIVLVTATATPALLTECTGMLSDGGLLLVFAGTSPGLRYHGLDIDRVRREQLTATTAGRTLTVAGTYGARREDFTTALALLHREPDTHGWSPADCVRRVTTGVLELRTAAAFLTTAAAHGAVGKTLIRIREAS